MSARMRVEVADERARVARRRADASAGREGRSVRPPKRCARIVLANSPTPARSWTTPNPASEGVYCEAGTVLRPAEVAELYDVTPRTIRRWADAGMLPVLRTVGGQRRFRWEEIRYAGY